MDSAVLADNAVDALGIDFDVLAEMFGGLVVEAGRAVMAVYAQGCSARLKSDASPVCAADERAEAIILDRLALRLPHIPVVAEEKASHGDVPVCGRAFILVDPLDGTKEFLNRNGEFTVNIALILDGTPRAGAVYAPALGRLWFGGNAAFSCAVAPGAALPARALWTRVHARRAPGEGLTAVASRSHADAQTEAFLATLSVRERRTSGSSVKFCTVAEGAADVYPRFGPTMEWDTAAGDAVLRAAGGCVLDASGAFLRYGKAAERYRNGAFIAWGDPSARPA